MLKLPKQPAFLFPKHAFIWQNLPPKARLSFITRPDSKRARKSRASVADYPGLFQRQHRAENPRFLQSTDTQAAVVELKVKNIALAGQFHFIRASNPAPRSFTCFPNRTHPLKGECRPLPLGRGRYNKYVAKLLGFNHLMLRVMAQVMPDRHI